MTLNALQTLAPDSAPKGRTSVVAQLTLFVAVVIVLLLGVLLAAGYFAGRRILNEEIDNRLAAVAESRRDFVREWIGRQEDRVTVFATRGVLRNFLEKHVARQPEEPQRTQSQENLDGHVRAGLALVARIVSREGEVLLSSDAGEVGRDFSHDPIFAGGLDATTVGLPRAVNGRYVADLAAPARWVDGTKATLGVVMLTVDVTSLADELRDRTGLGKTGEVLLGVKAGGHIRYLFPPRLQQDGASPPSDDSPAMGAAIDGREIWVRKRDYRGQSALAVGMPVGYGGWGLVVKMDEREAYAPIERARRLALWLAAGIGALGLVGAYVVARGFTRPIRRLAEAAEAVTRGDLNVTVPVRSGNELGALGEAFNAMTAALRARAAERDEAREAIRRSEELLRSILDHTEDSVFVKDRESRTIFKNPAGLRVNALPAEKVIGHTDAEFAADPAQAAKFLADDRRVMELRQTVRVEEVVTSATGERHVMLTTKTPRFDGEGNVIGLVGVARDITAQKEAERALRESEERLRTLGDNIPGGAIYQLLVPADGPARYLYMSAGIERLLGVPTELIVEDPNAFGRMIVEEDRARVAQAQERAARTMRLFDCEFRQRSARGEVKWIHARSTPRRLADGSVLWDGVLTDITERKAAEERLRESNARYELVVAGTFAGVWDWDVVARRVYFSPRWAEMRGYAPSEISDREEEWSSRIHPDDAERVIGALRAHIAGQTPVFSEEYRIRCKDGSWKWVLDRGIALRDASGNAIRMAGSEIDITERKQAEEAIKASLHEKEVLLREVHHRVKNNLQIVSSLLNLQCRQLTDPAMVKVFASTRDRVRAMAAVHERLYESGDFARIDLAAHLAALVRALVRAHAPAGVRFEPVLRLDAVTVDLNTAVPLSLIANELILNALKYALADRADGTLAVGLRHDGERNELRVTDNGPGFPVALDPATTRTLGLRLVRDLARQIDAQLEIDSNSSGTNIAIRWLARPAASTRTAFADEAGAPEI